jgi:hypothetical protein
MSKAFARQKTWKTGGNQVMPIANIAQWYKYAAVAVASFALSAVVFTQAVPATAQSSVEARLQRLEDESQIRHLLIEYGHDLDTRDYVGYSKLFARDGVWAGGIGTGKGPAGVLAMLQGTVGRGGNRPFDLNAVRSYHLDTNILIDFIDRDHAKAFSRWTVMSKSPDNKLVPSLAGRYDDVVVREDGKWKFQSRIAPHEIPNPDLGTTAATGSTGTGNNANTTSTPSAKTP